MVLQDYGKIYFIFIELCMKGDFLPSLKGNNSYNKNVEDITFTAHDALKTFNFRINSEMCKRSIIIDIDCQQLFKFTFNTNLANHVILK